MRKLLRNTRQVSERLLHPLRRRAATERVRQHPSPAQVLVVCQGNICRSPFAGYLLRRLLASRGIRVESAGFLPPGRPAPREAIKAARHRGVDMSGHCSRMLSPELVKSSGLIIVMDREQAQAIRDQYGAAPSNVILLGDLDPLGIDTRRVLDPVDMPLSVFEAVYDRIERCAKALAEALGSDGHPAKGV